MRAVAFTVDVDRDVNMACYGEVCSVSNGGTGPRFDSSGRGLGLITELLEEMGISGTFFWEGRTAQVLAGRMDVAGMMRRHEVGLHGFDHEDFSGRDTGIPLDRAQVMSVLDMGERALADVFGRRSRGFRAPYQRLTDELVAEMTDRGYLYDSSETVEMESGVVRPHALSSGLMELPVCWSRDRAGRRIVSYLWPYHEGRRPIDDYLELTDRFREGLLVLATHSWHPVETFSHGPRTEDDVRRCMEDLRSLLEHVERSGAVLVTLADLLRRGHAL